MTRGFEVWLWPLSIAGAIAVHGGLGLLLAGTSAEAAVSPPPLEITISTLPVATRATATETAVAAEVAVASVASPVAIAAALPAASSLVAATPSIATAPAIAPIQAIVPTTLSAAPVSVPAATSVPPAVVAAGKVGNVPTASGPEVIAAAPLPVFSAPAGAPPVAALAAEPVATVTQTVASTATSSNVLPPAAGMAVVASPSVLPVTSSATAGGAPVAAAAPVASAGTVVAVVQPSTAAVPSVAAAPASDPPLQLAAVEPAAPPPAPEETQASALADFVATFEGGNCFAAHVETTAATPSLSAYALDLADSVALQFGLSQSFDEPVEVAGYRAEPGQCAALAFVTQVQRLATGQASVVLDAQLVADGGLVSGVVLAPPGEVMLFIVDDEGKVADASAYLADDGRFSAPVRLTGEGAGKLQLVVAMATARPLEPPSAGQPAAKFFPSLLGQLRSGVSQPAVAIAAFAIE